MPLFDVYIAVDFSGSKDAGRQKSSIAFAEFERELIRERTIEGIRRAKLNGKNPGRPKGSKDKKPRRKSGYILREAKKKQQKDRVGGAAHQQPLFTLLAG